MEMLKQIHIKENTVLGKHKRILTGQKYGSPKTILYCKAGEKYMSDQKPIGRKIGYARVSRKDQNIEPQIIALQEAGCDKIFTDVGISGRIFPRKGLSNAQRILRPGYELLVHRFDRLGRDALELLKLQNRLGERKISLNALLQPLDLSTASGKLSYMIFAAMAEHESNINAERTKGSLAVRKRSGVRLGRPQKLSESQIILVREMYESGNNSLSAIARNFAVSPNTIKRLVSA